jgi:uncharacterized protein YqgC (DUF456 family)
MDLAQTGLLLAATILMIGALILSFVPILPGPVLVWAVSTLFAVLDGFARMSATAVLVSTAIMIAGATSDFWLPAFGVRTGGLTCLSAVGAFVGGIVATPLIPVPIFGTLIGMVLGAALVELVRLKQIGRAVAAGRVALKLYVASYLVELAASIAIFVVFIVSVQSAPG